MLISCDFDGVLIEHPDIPTRNDWWKDGPVEGALEAVRFLAQKHEIYVCTARPKEQWSIVEEWLRLHGFPSLEVTNQKKDFTSLYIDDRAYRFTNWRDISKLLA